jgi:iron-only hydrogenase group A
MLVNINSRKYEIAEGKTVYDAIEESSERLLSPELGEYRQCIHNPSCLLLGLADVDGCLTPLPVLKKRAVHEGMSIITDSQKISDELHSRAALFQEQHECFFVREWQKMVAVEGVNAGYIDMDNWQEFSFEKRITFPSIIHDPNKCIRCKACIDTCRDVQGVEALSFDEYDGVIVDKDRCVLCGQCIHHCPMGTTGNNKALIEFLGCEECAFADPLGAMREIDDSARARELLKEKQRYSVSQFAPSIRTSIGESFGMSEGELVTGKLYSSLRELGFKRVWDTNFAADLTIMEEGSEFIDRLANCGKLPQFTSCCPAWVSFVEKFFPDLIPNVSTAKSPQQMFGAVAKSFGAKELGIAPETMCVVSIMPCTAKKAEALRLEMNSAWQYWKEQGKDIQSFQDVDLVLTTRELSRLIKMGEIDFKNIATSEADPLLGSYTGAAPIFGRTGGVMEAALRTAVALLSGKPPVKLEFESLGTMEGIKKAELPLGDKILKVAVVHGLKNARKVCESIQSSGEFSTYHFIEVMACPGGCIGGGGQPIPTNIATRRERTLGLNYDDSDCCEFRMSHENPEIKTLYKNFLEKPLGHLSHHLLHTTYTPRLLTAMSSMK